jgi:putative toxin-antitoxin system antitoxin component (TIGR02293 family)
MARGAVVTAERVLETLGGPRVLKHKGPAAAELREHVRTGLPYASLEAVASRFDLAREELSAVLHLPLRTLARRKRERRLRADESDRLFRLARIAALGVEVLGSREKASRWLHRPNRALGDAVPLLLLDTDPGARHVEDVLLRIAHGVHS